MKLHFESQLHYQRLVLGVICGLLPVCCILFGLIGADSALLGKEWWYSISATYYANSNIWMIGSLVLASFFFATYKGYDWGDRLLTAVSAVSSLGIVVFPCWGTFERVGLFMLKNSVSNAVHCVFAALLFISFALMILTQFTKGGDNRRNSVYYVCGNVIVVFMLNQVLSVVLGYPAYWTWINEFVMLEAFAVAWIVKSKAISLTGKGE